MKKLLMATIGTGLLLGLTACGGDDEYQEVPQVIIIEERQPTLVEQFLEIDDLQELTVVFDGSNIAEIHARRRD